MLTSAEVLNKIFTPTQIRRGYDEREVDEFLDQVVQVLRYYEGGGKPGPQAPAAPSKPVSEESPLGRASRWLRGDPPR
jgi:DivIVA domain-containing protein